MPQSPRLTTYKEAKAKYLDGPKSILQNLPMPTPSIKTLFTGTDRACSYAHIPANQILNHILALGYECYFYWAGFEKYWTDIEHEVYPTFTDNGTYPCEFFHDAHNDVKEMMRNNPGMPEETSVGILQVWSDGFDAHNVKGNISNSIAFKCSHSNWKDQKTKPSHMLFDSKHTMSEKFLSSFWKNYSTCVRWGRDTRVRTKNFSDYCFVGIS